MEEIPLVLRVEHAFEAPGPQPNGLQGTPRGLWILDAATKRVELVSPSGDILEALQTTADRGSGVTESPEGLWVASTFTNEILKVDRSSGATLAALPTPGDQSGGAHGLEWQDGGIWVAVPGCPTSYRMDVGVSFAVSQTFPPPGDRPHGLAWHAGSLLCVETGRRAIYRLDPRDGRVVEKLEILRPFPEPHGMTLWDCSIWYCDTGSRAVCRISL